MQFVHELFGGFKNQQIAQPLQYEHQAYRGIFWQTAADQSKVPRWIPIQTAEAP
jgi:hypothetical protein